MYSVQCTGMSLIKIQLKRLDEYCFYPYDVTFVQKHLPEAEEERVIRRLVSQGVDWMETDDPEKLMALLDRIEEEDASR